MKVFLIILFLALIPTLARSQDSGSGYDWKTGSYYNWDSDGMGNTSVRGSNQNGMWRTNIDSSGSMRGTDIKGNPWMYNSGSGVYQNYGTGKTCIGSGASRTCF